MDYGGISNQERKLKKEGKHEGEIFLSSKVELREGKRLEAKGWSKRSSLATRGLSSCSLIQVESVRA